MSTILVVDDDPAVVALLRSVLADDGHEVAVAGSVPAALARLHDGPPELMILDVRMPGADGFQILRHVRRRADSPPVIMVTGERDTRDRALREGAFAHLAKPFELSALRDVVHAALR